VSDGLPLLISGAIYDFAGFLTTQEKTIQVGARVGASAVVDLLKEWAALRGLKLDDAAVLSWQEWLSPTPPEPTADVARDAARGPETLLLRQLQDLLADYGLFELLSAVRRVEQDETIRLQNAAIERDKLKGAK
jgi:hypothetical protein